MLHQAARRLRAFRQAPAVKPLILFGKNLLFTKTIAYRAFTLANPRLRRGEIRFSDLTTTIPERNAAPLDKTNAAEERLTDDQRNWKKNGYLILERCIPESLIDEYVHARASLPDFLDHEAYIHVPKMRAIALNGRILSKIAEIIGEPMGLSLSLSNWISTERNWHQDEYLNPPHVKAHYLAVWIALENIHPDCGPFEFVPGSHRWGTLGRAQVQRFMPLKDVKSPEWPKLSEHILNDVFEKLIAEKAVRPERFLAKKGDILIWHACLAHRGSVPNNPTLKRKALICHYTALSKGLNYYPRVAEEQGGKFFFYDSYAQS